LTATPTWNGELLVRRGSLFFFRLQSSLTPQEREAFWYAETPAFFLPAVSVATWNRELVGVRRGSLFQVATETPISARGSNARQT